MTHSFGLWVTILYLKKLCMNSVRENETKLFGDAMERLSEVPGLTIYGPTDATQRSGVVSFTLGDIHPHDVAAILDGENVAVRAGHHCTQPLMRALGLVATTRASFYVYNTPDDVDRLVAALHKVNDIFRYQPSGVGHQP